VIPVPDGTTTRSVGTHDGATLRVLERGSHDLPPLVLLHGITMGASAWTYQLRDLADRFRVVAYDLRGHDASSVGADGYGLSVLARDLMTILDDLDREDAIVVGHSMGAAALMRLCRDHPDVVAAKVRGLVFLSAGPGFDFRPRVERIVQSGNDAGLRLVERMRFKPWYRFPDTRAARTLVRLSFGRDPQPMHVEWTRQLLAAQDREAMLRSGFGMGDHDGVRVVGSIATRSIVVVGSHDRLTSPRLARRIHRSFAPGVARLEIIDGAGHQVMLERPAELDALVRAFADDLAREPTPVE
jgi:pimeloyl-ACP methyl ester carboxylesterase